MSSLEDQQVKLYCYSHTGISHSVTKKKKHLRSSLFWKTLLLILIPLVFEITFVYLLIKLSERADHLAKRLQDSQRMVACADRSLKASVELGLEVAFFVTNDNKTGGVKKLVRRASKQVQVEIDCLSSFSEIYKFKTLTHLIAELKNLKEITLSMGNAASEAGCVIR